VSEVKVYPESAHIFSSLSLRHRPAAITAHVGHRDCLLRGLSASTLSPLFPVYY
jgi:hypothetical protein